ncbi:MAG: hypothetical protein EPN23_02520 [Verrucomicrobia bacterium]|nr:MAG: hypothetical protein EPN23_02520 [Verrucomicrobiota bacterium]
MLKIAEGANFMTVNVNNRACKIRRRTFAYVFLTIGVLALLKPLLAHPAGVLSASRPDAPLCVFILEQVFQNIVHGRDWYYTQTFFPFNQAIALSSNLFLYQVIYTPLRLLGFNPQISFNMLYGFAFLLLGIMVFEWAYRQLHHMVPATCVALLSILLCVPVYYIMAHFQLLSAYYYLLLLMICDDYALHPKGRHILAGLVVVLLMFACEPNVAVTGVFITLIYVLIRSRTFLTATVNIRWSRRKFFAVGLGSIVVITALAWIAMPYLHAVKIMGNRPLQEAAVYSSWVGSILSPPGNSVFLKPDTLPWGRHEALHLSGFLYLGLGLAGCIYAGQQREKRLIPLFILLGIVYCASFGPVFIHGFPTNPFYLIPYTIMPGFAANRTPGRLVMCVLPLMSLFAVYFVFALGARVFNGLWRKVVPVGLVALMMLEGMPWLPVVAYNYEAATAHYTELNKVTQEGDSIIRLPYEPWPSSPSGITEEMLGILRTHCRTVNGYSSFDPPLRSKYQNCNIWNQLCTETAAPLACAQLASDRIAWIVIDKQNTSAAEREAILRCRSPRQITSETAHFLLIRP